MFFKTHFDFVGFTNLDFLFSSVFLLDKGSFSSYNKFPIASLKFIRLRAERRPLAFPNSGSSPS